MDLLTYQTVCTELANMLTPVVGLSCFVWADFTGPVYSLDINSAYPFAISQAPSLGENMDSGNTWKGLDQLRISASIEFVSTPRTLVRSNPVLCRYSIVTSVETSRSRTSVTVGIGRRKRAMVAGCEGVEIAEGWEWIPAEPALRPFAFLADMYAARQKIGKHNVMSMPYKLGPNSLYGKFAQRVGFTTDTDGIGHPA
jgi:hypothetical protein